jgi:hypothetical protein
MNESQLTFGVALTMLSTALGAFVKGTIMLTSTHKEIVADFERRLSEEVERGDAERRRADRFMEFGMRATGVTEELLSLTKSRDDRDLRDSQERERHR